MLHYSFGPWSTFRYVYPYYHRKYLFVSLGGYWPLSYRYRRYYWYGYHPYNWYGYYPIAREVQGDTYNYYTYNYYNDDNAVASVSGPVIDGIQPVDHNTFADVREKLAQQAAEEPGEVTLADTYFEEAVKAFEADNYDAAIEKFAEAMALAPDDIILPFAYSQALFAKEQYSQAAEVLRGTLANVSPEKEGIFYPRGLYPDDDGLFEQINRLAEKAELYSFDADLQLLLGYQLLGIGKLDEAVEPLQRASRDMENAVAATTLLNVLEKIRAENSEADDGKGGSRTAPVVPGVK
ncbi:MAG: tetratricopeptide repeat protein [Dehalococcoidales bacterium]